MHKHLSGATLRGKQASGTSAFRCLPVFAWQVLWAPPVHGFQMFHFVFSRLPSFLVVFIMTCFKQRWSLCLGSI